MPGAAAENVPAVLARRRWAWQPATALLAILLAGLALIWRPQPASDPALAADALRMDWHRLVDRAPAELSPADARVAADALLARGDMVMLGYLDDPAATAATIDADGWLHTGDCGETSAAGELAIPFTSGILIGIGETRAERIDSLFALRDLHERHGHLQEIIIQNFRAKPGTKMAATTEPGLDDLCWTIAVARLIFGAEMSIQVPPNLNAGVLPALVDAGLNDWGGVSPVTIDHVNPEAAWPHLDQLEAQTRAGGRQLVERLALVPACVRDAARWTDAAMRPSGFIDSCASISGEVVSAASIGVSIVPGQMPTTRTLPA